MKAAGNIPKIFFIYLAVFLCGVVLIPSPGQAAGKRSGNHGLNIHTKVKGDRWREVVQGHITKVRKDGIVMDGQFFSFSGAGLRDEHEAPLSYTDIYPGLRADVVYDAGSIEKIIIFNLSRPLVIKDMRFIQQERSKALRKRR
jgi:hypothetical protein